MSIYRLTAILFFLLAPVVPGLFAKDQASAPIAEVGGIKISESEMKLDIGSEVYEAEANIYQLKKNWIDQKARTILFEDAAKKAGLSLEDWQHKEIEEKVGQPSEENVREMAQRIIRQQNPGCGEAGSGRTTGARSVDAADDSAAGKCGLSGIAKKAAAQNPAQETRASQSECHFFTAGPVVRLRESPGYDCCVLRFPVLLLSKRA
jgi:hypothetical protein